MPINYDPKTDHELKLLGLEDTAGPINKQCKADMQSGKLQRPETPQGTTLNGCRVRDNEVQVVSKDSSECQGAIVNVGQPGDDPQVLYYPNAYWSQCFGGSCQVTNISVGPVCYFASESTMDKARSILGVNKPAVTESISTSSESAQPAKAIDACANDKRTKDEAKALCKRIVENPDLAVIINKFTDNEKEEFMDFVVPLTISKCNLEKDILAAAREKAREIDKK